MRLRFAAAADSDRVWRSVDAEIRRVLDQHGLTHVRVERAKEPPEQAAGGKYRAVIPLERPEKRAGEHVLYGILDARR